MRLLCSAVALLGAAAIAACSSSSAATTAGTVPGTLYIVGVDVSGSRTPTQLSEGKQLIDALIDRMTNGDKLVVVQTYQQGTDAAGHWEDAIPAAHTPGKPNGADRKKAERFRSTAKMVTATFFDSAATQHVMTTDLLFTIGRAADYAKAAEGRRVTLVLMSDMLNATRELNMERQGGVPDAQWVAERKAQGRLPDLRGVCVVVSGADVSSARGAQVRDFWRAYFAASEAKSPDVNYRNMISSAAEIGCS
jgi:hypothetical protein